MLLKLFKEDNDSRGAIRAEYFYLTGCAYWSSGYPESASLLASTPHAASQLASRGLHPC